MFLLSHSALLSTKKIAIENFTLPLLLQIHMVYNHAVEALPLVAFHSKTFQLEMSRINASNIRFF
nr:MAG TPA: hypothetical protein [Caudoviricetes sp.]